MSGGHRPGVCELCGEPTSRSRYARCGGCARNNSPAAKPDVELPPRPTLPQHGEDAARDLLVERLRVDRQVYERAYSQKIKEEAAEERLIDLFKASIARFPAIPGAAFKTPASHVGPPAASEVPVLLIGDQQIGESISAEETFGINRYNFHVYQARLEHLEARIVDILTSHQRAPFSEMVVFSMGDNVSGVIHDELQKFGHQHVVDQVYLGALTSALFLYRLFLRLRPRGIRRIRVSCVSGNHGRLSQAKESKQYFRNFDLLFHSIVAQALRDVPAIEFHIPRCLFTVVEVAGHRILQSHGHELPPSSLGIPLYSINRASAGYQELLSWTEAQRFDYWVMGHFHRPMELDNAIVNGTMAGLGEFGIGRFKPIRPMQKLLGFTEKWGLAWQYGLRLDQAPAPSIYTFDPDMATSDALALFADRQRKATA